MATARVGDNEVSFQRDHRRGLTAYDQHGRAWEATVETQGKKPSFHPVGEPLLVYAVDRKTGAAIVPPLIPPLRHMHYNIDNPSVVRIDYDAWIAERQSAAEEWQTLLTGYAQSMYGDKAGEAIQKPTPELLRLLGPKPAAFEQVAAAQKGNKWVLGLPMPDGSAPRRPEWADKYFPLPEPEKVLSFPDADEFPDAEDEGEDEAGDHPRFKPGGKYTKDAQTYSGRWELSDGTLVIGSKQDAEDAEAALQAELAPTG